MFRFIDNNPSFQVSIIVPVYDVEPYLRECLDSIVNQTYRNLEIILVDDGSTDYSGSICDEYAERDKRITVVHKKNQGQSVARNVGLDIAKGKYIWFIDSDDLVEFNAVELLVNKAEETQCEVVMFDCSVVYPNKPILFEGVVVDSENPLVYKKITNDYWEKSDKNLLEIMLDGNDLITPVWSKFFERSFLKNNNLRFVKDLIHEDNLFTVDYVQVANKICKWQKCLYNYRIRENSTMTTTETNHLLKRADSLCFLFHEFYSMYRREKITEYVFKRLIEINLFQYLHSISHIDYEKHYEIARFLEMIGVIGNCSQLCNRPHNLILYGAGKRAQHILQRYTIFPIQIFDMNAENIQSLCGIPVVKPDFSAAENPDNIIVISIADVTVAKEIRERFGSSHNVVPLIDYLVWFYGFQQKNVSEFRKKI